MAETLIQNIRFDDRGLIPAILQDAATSEIVALRYMDSASLVRTLQTGQADFVTGGDTPGLRSTHRLLDVRLNTDGGSLIVIVEREAGAPPQKKPLSLLRDFEEALKPSSSEVSLVDVGSMEFGLGLNKLYGLIADRKQNRPEGSYTSYLFNSGLDKILKKIAEESGEVLIAAKNSSQREMISELADLFYHLIVLMVERDVALTDVNAELTRRANQPPERKRRSEQDDR